MGFKTTDKGIHISPFLVDTEWRVTKEPLFLIRGGNYLMCECSLLEVEAKPTRREQLWTNTFLHSESKHRSIVSFFFLPPLPSSTDQSRWAMTKNLEHSNAFGEKSKYCCCASRAGTEYLGKLIWRSSRGRSRRFLYLIIPEPQQV